MRLLHFKQFSPWNYLFKYVFQQPTPSPPKKYLLYFSSEAYIAFVAFASKPATLKSFVFITLTP